MLENAMTSQSTYITDAISDLLSHIVNGAGLYGLLIFASGLVNWHRSIINDTSIEMLRFRVNFSDMRYAIYYLLISLIISFAIMFALIVTGGGVIGIFYTLSLHVSFGVFILENLKTVLIPAWYIISALIVFVMFFLLLSFLFTKVYQFLPRIAVDHSYKEWPETIQRKLSPFSGLSMTFAGVVILSVLPGFFLLRYAEKADINTLFHVSSNEYFILSSFFQVYAVLVLCSATSIIYKKHVLPELQSVPTVPNISNSEQTR